MGKRRRHKKMSDQIRELIRSSEHTQYRIAVESDIDHGAMSNFLAGRRGLGLESLDRLAKFLDLEIVPRKRR